MKRALLLTLGLANLVAALAAAGCQGASDAPTNTANSQYVGNGKSAADMIGAQREHRRLPNGGKGAPQGQ